MTKCNFVSLSSGCGTQSCRWSDSCGCSDSCNNSCGWGSGWNCGWSCGCNTGCANGCSTYGCANGCSSNGCLNGCLNGCGNGCLNNCGSWGCNTCGNWGYDSCGCCDSCGICSDACSCLWPDAPALPNGGTLTSRIIGTGRLCQRVNDLTLCVGDIPDAAQPPYALIGVSASGPIDWEFLQVERWRAVLRVTIPLTAQIRDCAGCVYTGHSSITVDVPVRITIPVSDLGRAHVAVTPGVRLLCVQGCSEDGCFTVSLAVLVDVYIARWEPTTNGITNPCRPDLPLTLPIHFNRC